jgi:hypothetical protein
MDRRIKKSRTGCAGPGHDPGHPVKVHDTPMYTSAGTVYSLTFSGQGPTTVTRSSKTAGDQLVMLRVFLQKWDGVNWVKYYTSSPVYGLIPTGKQSVSFAAPSFSPIPSNGYYRIRWGIDWYNNGVLLGSTFVNSDRAGDHICGAFRQGLTCQNYTGGFVYIKGPFGG